jgi:hypothetical protein
MSAEELLWILERDFNRGRLLSVAMRKLTRIERWKN